MNTRKIVLFAAIGLAYGCGGGDSGSPLPAPDAGNDGTSADSGSMPDDSATGNDATTTDDGGPTSPDGGLDATSTDGGSADASGDAPTDGPSFDGNLACLGTNAACVRGTDAGAATNGLCASSVCGPCTTKTDDGLCNAAYGGDAGRQFVCANASCVPGNCHADGDCSGAAFACVNNACTACDGVASGTFYVDPINGSDSATSTGSDTAGGQARSACAFKTITRALAVVGAPSTSTKVVVLGPATVSAGETFPLAVPQNVVIQGQGVVTVDVPATTPTEGGVVAANGFVLAYPNSGIEALAIDGQSLAGAAGVLVKTGSAATTYLRNVTVENFVGGDGVRVTGSGSITLDEGVSLTKNFDGLALGDTASANSTNTNALNLVAFTKNTHDGIDLTGSASISLVGAAGAMGAGSILVSQNGSGIVMAQAGPGINMPQSVLTGVSAWQNTAYGLDLQGGSRVKVRSSFIGANAIGVGVRTSTSGTNSNETAYVDLGTAADFGKNTFQSLAPGDGGVSAQNTSVGICYAILPNSSQTLSANGNYWVNAAGTAPIDCTATAPGGLSHTSVCAGGGDLAGAGVQLSGGAGKNTVVVDNCSP